MSLKEEQERLDKLKSPREQTEHPEVPFKRSTKEEREVRDKDQIDKTE